MTYKKQAGFTLTELLIAAGIMAIVATGTTTLVTNYLQVQKNSLALQTRNSIYSSISETLKSRNSIVLSSSEKPSDQGNRKLSNCLFYTKPPCPTSITSPSTQTPFHLFKEMGKDKSGNQSLQRVAGTPSDPVRYNLQGAVGCSPSTDNTCIFEAISWFWAECHDATTCAEAILVYFRHQVRICNFNSGGACEDLAPLYKDKYILSAFPTTQLMNEDKSQFAVPILVSDLKTSGEYECTDPNARLISSGNLNEFGMENNVQVKNMFRCTCAPGYVQNGNQYYGSNIGDVVCIQSSEAAKTFDECVASTTSSGYVSAILPTGQVECSMRKMGCGTNGTGAIITGSTVFNCPAGSWLVAFKAGKCTVGSNKKDGEKELTCTTSDGMCCGWIK